MNCPACNVKMEPLVEGIFKCPKCQKIIKEKIEETEEKEKIKEKGEFIDGEHFHNNVGLNKQYEICEKGITISKTEKRWFAVLICHSAYLKNEKYVRLSWWKNLQHAGMIKIHDKNVLKNMILTLEKIHSDFDDLWIFKGKKIKPSEKSDYIKEKEKELDIIKYRILENNTCPNCQKKMNKMKAFYECLHCGEIVILDGYNQPLFDIPNDILLLNFHTNFPINYYLPVSGITIKQLMGEWKAVVVIYSKDNPNKKWLRFYWWVRDLQHFLKYGRKEMGGSTQVGWKTQKGVGSPNIYNKNDLIPLIEALKKSSKELGWDIE